MSSTLKIGPGTPAEQIPADVIFKVRVLFLLLLQCLSPYHLATEPSDQF